MNIYNIYRITNTLNNKVYIGFSVKPESRIKTHFAVHRDSIERFTKLQNAIVKYGADAFVADVIYQAKEDVPFDVSHTLTVMESFFIQEYDSIKNGYNVVPGGMHGPAFSGEENGMYGRTHSDAVRNKLSDLAVDRFKGKTYDELYGKEKANILRQKRSSSIKEYRKKNPPVGNKNANAKTILLISPDQIGYVIRGGLRRFCTEHALDVGITIDVLKGRRQYYKQWTGAYLA